MYDTLYHKLSARFSLHAPTKALPDTPPSKNNITGQTTVLAMPTHKKRSVQMLSVAVGLSCKSYRDTDHYGRLRYRRSAMRSGTALCGWFGAVCCGKIWHSVLRARQRATASRNTFRGGNIAITPKRGDGTLSYSFLLPKHSPYRETPTPKRVSEQFLDFTYYGKFLCYSWRVCAID